MGNVPLLEDLVFRPRYDRARLEHKPHLPALDPTQARVLDDLESHGVAMTSLDELAIPGSDALLASARAISKDLARLAR